jgi:hypothetical protein
LFYLQPKDTYLQPKDVYLEPEDRHLQAEDKVFCPTIAFFALPSALQVFFSLYLPA